MFKKVLKVYGEDDAEFQKEFIGFMKVGSSIIAPLLPLCSALHLATLVQARNPRSSSQPSFKLATLVHNLSYHSAVAAFLWTCGVFKPFVSSRL
jgi:hypothetical protein